MTRPAKPSTATTAADFWALLDRWNISEAHGAAIIGHPPTRRSGPLSEDQLERLEMLREIDRLAAELYRGDPEGWLRRSNSTTAFEGRSPLGHIIHEGRAGIEHVLHHLLRIGTGGEATKRR